MNMVTALGAKKDISDQHITSQYHAHKNIQMKICFKQNEEDDDVKDQTARNDKWYQMVSQNFRKE